MSMPPSGVEGLMDEQSVIEAEIQLELENINLDDEVQLDDDLNGDVGMQQDIEEQDVEVAEVDSYIKRLQEQSNRFEQELLECDELLTHSSTKNESVGSALIPYEDQTLLMQLAKEQGCDVEEYRRKILEDIENDEDILEDDLADLIDDKSLGSGRNGEQCSITETGETGPAVNIDAGLPVKIEKAVEEGMDYEEVPVSQELVLANGEGDGHPNMRRDIQRMLKEQLESLEHRYQERIDRIKKDEAYRRDEEEVRERRVNEERQWKLQEIQRQEQQLVVQQEMAEREIQKEQELAEKEMQENMRKFQEEMAQLQADMERQKKEHEMMIEMERQRQEEKQLKAAVAIQRTYRGYRVRKDTQPVLTDRREIRKKEKEEQRIQELEIVIEKRKEEQHQQEELDRQKQEEEKRQKEELKRQKEEEKKRLEEEKRRKKEEEERIKQEEKRRKEEEKQKKKEEEKRRKEEEKRRKEEEEQRKREEKRLKEEEEKRRKEEEKRQKEEEKRRKEEEKRLKEEEKKKEKERQFEEERMKKEQEVRLKEEMKNNENGEKNKQYLKESEKNITHINIENENKSNDSKNDAVPEVISENSTVENKNDDTNLGNSRREASLNTDGMVTDKTAEIKNDIVSESTEALAETMINGPTDNTEGKGSTRSGTNRPKTPRSARTSKTPRPPTPRKDSKNSKKREEKKEVAEEKKEIKADILPDHLEALRLKFIKDCQPWSKVSNEPWKLKAGVSRKPLRRPSSAKKMPLLSEDVIIQAARVASLKMVTTVELKDLPGNNMSTLGQCGGLRYLTLDNCNLVAVEGLGQCKQLQYVSAQDNKIEYIDLKDVGQLQYLNLSHNKLSSIHGLDNCTNLRWLDVSYNNITRLGGMDTMRRLHTLKLSHNQLISTQGLGATPTLQMLDVSHNHLQAVEDLDKLCLLFSLNAASNNLLQVPSLHNQVLLLELLLCDNSISSLSVLAAVWLPLLSTVQLQQNSLSELPSLQNCFLLKELNLSDNQITDPGTVHQCVEACFYLEQLHLQENPVHTDLNESFYTKLKCSCPRINCSPELNNDTAVKLTPVKPRNSFETMCLTQIRALKDTIGQFEHNIKLSKTTPLDQSQVCDVHYKFCDRTFNVAVEYRYAHEYGDISVAMPTAPTGPKSGRPLSSRQREKFMNPKEMFENALKSTNTESNSVNITNEKEIVDSNPKDLFENALKSQTYGKQGADSENNTKGITVPDPDVFVVQQSHTANPRDLFEQALKSADRPTHGTDVNPINGKGHLSNGHVLAMQSKHERGLHSPHKMTKDSKVSQASTTIQAVWRGYQCRKQLSEQHQNETGIHIEPAVLEKMNKSAVIIQASWKGYILRKKLLAALEYAQCDFEDEDDEDAMDFGDEFDLDKFVDIDQDLLDTDWKPPDTPDIPLNYTVLKKPPSGKPRVPPINTSDLRPPSNPRRAWRNVESPLSDMGKIPRPPSSVASTELTMRSGVSKKEEKMAEEWGFKDSSTAHLMMQRAKKMKYNAERRKKISKLDPKQRLALFRKLEEVIHPQTHTVPQRKTLPRKEYFQARQDEMHRQEQEKRQEYHNKASRTFEWLHTQVGDHVVSDSIINQAHADGPKYIHATENNLPELLNGGKRVQLVSSPMSVELQSVDSASIVGQKARRFSAGSGTSTSKLPPIQPSSAPAPAPAPAPHLKERMSFRNPKVNQSVGWGGGKKRGTQFLD